MGGESKRWTARRKSTLVLDMIQGKTAVSDSSQQFDLPPSEINSWIDQAILGMESALKVKPEGIREQYEAQLKALQEAYGEAIVELCACKNGTRCWARRTRHNPLIPVWLERKRFHGFDDKALFLVQCSETHGVLQARGIQAEAYGHFATSIKQLIEAEPSFDYRTVANLPHCTNSTAQRVF